MKTVELPQSIPYIEAPFKDIHLCPICHEPYLEEPQESSLFTGLMVCPHCRKQDNALFFYWTQYKPIIEEEKPMKVDEYGAFLLNDRYTFIAFRAFDRSWDYTLFDEEGTVLESGQIGDENTSFMDAMSAVAANEIGSIRHYEEIPWTAANLMLELAEQ